MHARSEGAKHQLEVDQYRHEMPSYCGGKYLGGLSKANGNKIYTRVQSLHGAQPATVIPLENTRTPMAMQRHRSNQASGGRYPMVLYGQGSQKLYNSSLKL